MRQKGGHLLLQYLAFQIRHDHRDVTAKFPDDLAAGSAGWRERVRVGNDGDRFEATFAFGDGFEDGGALSATRQAKRRIFNIAT